MYICIFICFLYLYIYIYKYIVLYICLLLCGKPATTRGAKYQLYPNQRASDWHGCVYLAIFVYIWVSLCDNIGIYLYMRMHI